MVERGLVLLLHGVQSGSSTWWRVAADLSDLGVRVIALDLAGHGGRPAASELSIPGLAVDVAAQLDAQGIGTVDLVVGHSLGALVALSLLEQQPGRARRLLLEDPPALGPGLSPQLVAAELEQGAAAARRDRAELVAVRTAENPLWSRADVVNSVDNLLAVEEAAVTAMLRAAPDWDLPAVVAACAVPVELLMARGPASAVTEPGRSQLRQALPAGRLTEVDSGHSVHRDRPGVWVATVLTAVRRATSPPVEAVVAAERELHEPAKRMDRALVADRLDPGYTEIGRSGRLWHYVEMVEALAGADMSEGLAGIVVDEEQVRPLGDSLSLLTYRSVVGDRVTRRSSIWRADPDGLRIVHHQGTPVPD